MSIKTIVWHRHTVQGKPDHPWLLWLRRHRRVFDIAGLIFCGLAVLSSAAQLLYPADKALPLMSVGGIDVGGKSQEQIVAMLSAYGQDGEVTISTPHKKWQAKWQSIGVSIDADATAEVALTYDWWERIIPFSSAITLSRAANQPMIALTDEDRLNAFTEKLVKEEKLAAANATLRIEAGQVVVDEAQNGYEYTPEDVRRQIQTVAVTKNSNLQLVPRQVAFVRSAAQLQAVKAEAEAMLGHSLQVTVADKVYKPGRDSIGGWLAFNEDPATKNLQLVLNKDAVKLYLEEINRDIKIDPGTVTITLIDGQEIGHTPLPQGRSVALDSSIAAIETALKSPKAEATVPLTIAPVAPRVNYVRTYSQSNAGLLAIIQDWQRTHYGDYAVIVREIGGQNRYAEVNPDKPYVTASTFKMFVFYAVAKKMEAGEITYATGTDMGWSVEACLEEMIVRSTNPCAVSLMNLVGWQTSQDIVAAAGFSATNINNYSGGDKHSSIRDETNFMLRLQAGTLMAEEPTSRLMGYFKRQIWRAGIPAGVPAGTVVADKVGLYNGWVHDVGIVYGPKSTYILGIMSRNGSDPAFANLSRKMYDFFKN